MIKTKEGYGKLIGSTYLGVISLILLSNGGNIEYSIKSKENTIVLRDSNQLILATYFNTLISDESLEDIGSVYVRNNSDTLIRRINKDQFYSIIDEKFVTLDTVLTITGGKTFTTQINSSVTTSTYLEGNKGRAIINSIAGYGSYVMLFKGNSNNGYFTHGVYLGNYLLLYTAKSVVDEGSNAVSKSVLLLNESGNSSFPGNVTIAGTVSGNILESRVATGTKPLNIASTTLVTNLNSDLLDGYHSRDMITFGGDINTSNSYVAGLKVFGISGGSSSQLGGGWGSILQLCNDTARNYAPNTSGRRDLWYSQLILTTDNRVRARFSTNGAAWTSLQTLAYITDNVASATQVKVTLHTTNNTNYPVVWSNQNNTNTGNSDLFKSWDHLYYNPSTHVLTSVGGLMGGFLDIATGDLKITSTTDYRKIQTYDSKPLSINPEGNNVGIGLTNPSYKLHVNGTLRATNTTVADLFVNTGDATLKIYSGKASDGDGKSDGNICFQTSIDSTDGQTHAYPTQYPQRCNISLLPRGGLVYIGTNPSTGNTGNKLYVNGNSYTTGYFSGNTLTARVATGTAPLNITSTTLVTNLNVDFLRGYIPIGTSGSVIRKRGSSVGGTTAAWCRMAKYTSNSTDTLTDVAFLLHSSYSRRYSVLHIKSRGGSYVKALLYNSYGMDASKIRVYYDSGKSNIEFYYYAGENYSVIIAELLYSTGRGGSWDNNITMYEKDTSSPSYSTYVVPEYPSMLNNADSATKLLNPRKLWGQSFDGTADVSGDMTGVGWINGGLRVDYGDDLVGLRWRGVHSVEFGGNTGYAHTSYYFRPSYSSSGSTLTSLVVQNASASNSPTFTTTHAFWADGVGYHKRALGVGRESPSNGYAGGIYANTILVNDWFRSEGNTGWYSQTYGGGWYMTDDSWIRAYNNKGVRTEGIILTGSGFRTGNSQLLQFTPYTHKTVFKYGYDTTYGDFILHLIPGENNQSILMKLSSYRGLVVSGPVEATEFIGSISSAKRLANNGNVSAIGGTSTFESGLGLYKVYTSYGYPCDYGNLFRIGGSGYGELLAEWTNSSSAGHLYYRSKRDITSLAWSGWKKIAFTDDSVKAAEEAHKLLPHYDGGVKTNPLLYFGQWAGVKVAMTGVGGMGSYWTDTLWINGYTGGDVKGMCALHFSRQNGPRFSISSLNFDSTSYGTSYEVFTNYTLKWAIYLFEFSSTRLIYTKYAGNTDFVSSKYTGNSTSISVYINSSYPVNNTMIIGVGHSHYDNPSNPMYACVRKDSGSNRITVIGGDDSSANSGTVYIYFLYFR